LADEKLLFLRISLKCLYESFQILTASTCICTAEKMQITKAHFHVSQQKKLPGGKNETILSIFKHFLLTAFY